MAGATFRDTKGKQEDETVGDGVWDGGSGENPKTYPDPGLL